MTYRIANFIEDESGAVTTDWVVITAALVGLALAAVAEVRSASLFLADRISEEVIEEGMDALE